MSATRIDRFMEFTMDFREFVEGEEMVGESIASSLGKGIIAGALSLAPFGSAVGDYPSAVEKPAHSASDTQAGKIDQYDPVRIRMKERLKDQGKYYDSMTMRKLVDAAKKGDEWAMREVPWPKGHEFHKMGRPFFRNDAPHPQGLVPRSEF